MKIRIIGILAVLALAMLAGCGQSVSQLEPEQIFSVRSRNNGKVLSMGDSQDSVAEVTGGSVRISNYFEDERVYRQDYYNAEGLLVDTFEDTVVGLRLSENDKWEISSGVRIGMTKSEVWDLYKNDPNAEQGMKGGVLIAYDSDYNPVPFTEEFYYLLQITFDEDDIVDYVGLQSRVAEMTLRERGEWPED